MWTVGWGRCKFPALLKVTLLKQRGASTSVFPDYGFGGAGSRSQWSTRFNGVDLDAGLRHRRFQLRAYSARKIRRVRTMRGSGARRIFCGEALNIGIPRFGFTTEDAFSYQVENGLAIFENHSEPCHFPHHRKIDAAETQSRKKDVHAIAERLVVERIDCMGQRLRVVGVRPAVVHLGMSFVDRHF